MFHVAPPLTNVGPKTADFRLDIAYMYLETRLWNFRVQNKMAAIRFVVASILVYDPPKKWCKVIYDRILCFHHKIGIIVVN